MGIWASSLLLLGFIGVVAFYWRQIFESRQDRAQHPLWVWIAKGALAPALIWVLLNLGLSSRFPPLVLEIGKAQASGGAWVPLLLRATAAACWAIGSCWAGVSFAWLAASLVLRADKPKLYLGVLVSWSFFSLPVALLFLFWLGWPGLGLSAVLWLAPAVHNMIPLLDFKAPEPSYHRAVAKMKFGKYNEAEWEVIQELEKCEDDFVGWMMLAELYAVHFHDLPAAAQTVHDVCAQPNITISQIAVALHRLADWQLKLAEDPVAARRTLEDISCRAPGSHLDKMARMRIDQLPASREELREQRQVKTLRLSVLRNELDATDDHHAPDMTKEEAARRANQCVERLKRNPNDVEAREEFAKLLAEQLGQPELALEQIELLRAMPGRSGHKAAEWLGVMAAWQIKYRHDPTRGRELLERLIQEFPQSQHAFEAQRRLNQMDVEQRFRKVKAAAANSGTDPARDRKPAELRID